MWKLMTSVCGNVENLNYIVVSLVMLCSQNDACFKLFSKICLINLGHRLFLKLSNNNYTTIIFK